jgi:small subunit ribosomal protein S17e
MLRRKAEELYKLYPEKFSTDFDHNKQALKEMNIFQSKGPRNIVAGLMVKLAQEKEL